MNCQSESFGYFWEEHPRGERGHAKAPRWNLLGKLKKCREVTWLEQREPEGRLDGDEAEGLWGPDHEGPRSQKGVWLLLREKGKPLDF